MRIVSVTAADFGPLQRRTLGLAPGLTVVVGANESGKSSWHAALYAALCGRRRGRGRPGVVDQRFIDAHRPWGGRPWQTSAELQLDDGREIEIRQELVGLVDCRAVDLGLNRDVSAEIMSDGSPDASVWCGLTRQTFRATACVGQGELLAVLDSVDGLQEALQRAVSVGAPAAGAGRATAAAAIEDLEACRRAAVGREATSSVRPLRRALDALRTAEQGVESARAAAAELAEAAGRRAEAAEQLARCAPVPARPPSEPVPEPSVGLAEPVGAPVALRWGSLAAALAAAVLLAVLGLLVSGVARGAAFVVAAALVLSVAAAAVRAGQRVQYAHVRTRRGPGPPQGSRNAGQSPVVPDGSVREAALRRRHDAELRLARADAELTARAAGVPALATAEEQLAAAHVELARVRELDETLGLTIGFLARAQEQVHREVAPELSASVSAHLPRVTGGRYTAARIDPAALAIEVRDASGTFRPARALSHGTAEQVHLLLRVALVDLLGAGHDTCPLLLDDVTVHADPDRTDGMLELLLQLASQRQVVVFAQQDQVRAWAAARLDGVRHAFVDLDRVTVELDPPGSSEAVREDRAASAWVDAWMPLP